MTGIGLMVNLLLLHAAVGDSRASFRVGATVVHPGCAIAAPQEGVAGRMQCTGQVPVVVAATRDRPAEFLVVGTVARLLLPQAGQDAALLTITY